MPYYDIYIGKEKFVLYIKDEPFNLYMHEAGGALIYGTLSYTYDKSTQTFTVKIDELSERGQYIFDKGFLSVAPEIKENHAIYKNQRAQRTNYEGRERFRLAYASTIDDEHPRGRLWYSPNALNKTFYGSTVTFTIGELERITFDKGYWSSGCYDSDIINGYVTLRFNLYNSRSKRFVKTICEPMFLYKP